MNEGPEISLSTWYCLKWFVLSLLLKRIDKLYQRKSPHKPLQNSRKINLTFKENLTPEWVTSLFSRLQYIRRKDGKGGSNSISYTSNLVLPWRLRWKPLDSCWLNVDRQAGKIRMFKRNTLITFKRFNQNNFY